VNKVKNCLWRVKTGILFLCVVCSVVHSGCWAGQKDRSTEQSRVGFTTKVDENGKYWFVDPKGDQFLSIGINNISSQPYQPKPDTQYYQPVPSQFSTIELWKQDVFKILGQNGFNTIGAWSDGQLYDGPVYGTICLYVASYAKDRPLDGLRSGFKERVRKNVHLMLEKYPHIEKVFGVFLDNEMHWYGHAPWGEISNYTLLEVALSLPKEDDARRAAINFVKERYPSVEKLSKAWGKPLSSWDELTFEYARSCVNPQVNEDRKAFIEFAAQAFYKTATAVVRQMLPGKLILGTRFAGYAPVPVIRACGRYCDVISFNDYRPQSSVDQEMLSRFWIWGGKKPLMITEYAWRAEENTSGNPNTAGGGAVVKTQADRAQNYQKYIEELFLSPMVIGAHWFEFADQSPQGRYDGEDSNYGVVDIYHRPYTEVLAAMQKTNARLESLHAQSERQVPESLPKRNAVVFQLRQRPDRSPFVDLLAAPIKGQELFHAPDATIELREIDDYFALPIDSGDEWGCGVLFFGPKEFGNSVGPEFSTDMGGYSAIEIDAVIGQSTVFNLFLDEAGVDAPNVTSFDMTAGDDAESFVISSIQGRSERFLYRFELKDLKHRKDWGNQKGLREVDMHAMKGVALLFYGGQGQDQIRVYSLKLVR